MKKLFGMTLFIAAAAIFGACEKKEEYYITNLPQSYEYHNVSFDTSNNARSSDIKLRNPGQMYLGDFVLVYFLDAVQDNGNPVWTPLPTSYYIDVQQGTGFREAEINYKFSYSLDQVVINANSADLLSLFKGNKNDISFTNGLTFKVVYLPGEDPIEKGVKSTSLFETDQNGDLKAIPYETLSQMYDLDKVPVRKIDYSTLK